MSAAEYLLVGFLVGGGLGLLIGWLYGRGRVAPPNDRLENELKQQLATSEKELEKTRAEAQAQATERASAQAHHAALASRFAELQGEMETLREHVKAEHAKIEKLQSELASALARGDVEQKNSAQKAQNIDALSKMAQRDQARLLDLEKLNGELQAKATFLEERLTVERSQWESLQARFTKEFESIANKLLLENSSRFGQQSAESLDKLLGPLRENLQDFKLRLESAHKDTVAHSTLLKDQISRIGSEAANLSKALKGDVKVLGNWGENMLDVILEKSGLQLGVHYHRQSTAHGQEGDARFLDVVIHLPENKHLVIDSKVSLKAYEEHVNCPDAGPREARLNSHVESIRAHFRGLGSKRYQEVLGISAPDFVLMYIPIEGAFFAAIGKDPGLFSEALDRNVVLTTNSTLLATLRTVAHVWRLADQQKNAIDIAERGGRLYDKFVGFVNDLQDIGKALDGSQALLKDACGKLHTGPGNLLWQAETLKKLGVKAKKALPSELLRESTPAAPSLPLVETPRAALPAQGAEQLGL